MPTNKCRNPCLQIEFKVFAQSNSLRRVYFENTLKHGHPPLQQQQAPVYKNIELGVHISTNQNQTDPNNGHCHLTWDQADAKTADKLKEQKVRKWKFQGSYCES